MKPSERAEVRRRLAAPPERVFAAFASAEIVAQWLTPAPDVKVTVLELDFREGGRYRFAYDTPEGQRMLVGGQYLSIEAPSRLVFSWVIEPPDIHLRAGVALVRAQGACVGLRRVWRRTIVELHDHRRCRQERDELGAGRPSHRIGYTAAQWLIVGPLTAVLLRRAEPSQAVHAGH